MSPKITAQMLEQAKKDGADVTDKRKVAKPKPPVEAPKVEAKTVVSTDSDRIRRLEAQIVELREALDAERKAAENRTQELTALLAGMGETKPIRIKPVRDLDPNSKQYLLVQHFDIVPVEYRPKRLDS